MGVTYMLGDQVVWPHSLRPCPAVALQRTGWVPIPSHHTGDMDHRAASVFSLNFSLNNHKRRIFDLTNRDLMALFSLAICLRRHIKGVGGGRGVLNTAMTAGFIFHTRKQTFTGHSQVTKRQDIAE